MRKFISSCIVISLLVPFAASADSAKLTKSVAVLWAKGIELSGYYLLSKFVDRRTKTYCWDEGVWASPPVFSEFEIKRVGDQFNFLAGNLHEGIAEFSVEAGGIVGNPCAFFGDFCITELTVIDSDTFSIVVNSKKSTFFRAKGMKQISCDE